MPASSHHAVNLAQIATRLAEQHQFWEPMIVFDPAERYYTRLAREPQFEAWLLTWLPGQRTEWHDHGQSAGAFVTVRGSLTERYAMVQPDGPPRIVPRTRELVAGTLRSFGRRHLHEVANLGAEPAVSLHVYSPALVRMNTYRPEGNLLRPARSQLAGRNW
jgi:hypothetical protein